MENNTILLETDDKVEAVREWKHAHQVSPNLFHEIHQYWPIEEMTDQRLAQYYGHYNGLCQYAPGDIVKAV